MPIGPTRTKEQKSQVVSQEMHKFKHGELRSGSKKGPLVKNRKQAIAIALSESGQSKYDRSSHHKGNPGFDRSETVKSPPPQTYAAHESREKEEMGAGYAQHEKAEMRHSPGASAIPRPPAPNAHCFQGTQKCGVLRVSGKSGAHQIGKRSGRH